MARLPEPFHHLHDHALLDALDKLSRLAELKSDEILARREQGAIHRAGIRLDIDLERVWHEHSPGMGKGERAELQLEIARLRATQRGEEREVDTRRESIEALLIPLRVQTPFAVARIAARRVGGPGA